MEDDKIIELFFQRSEQAIEELSSKYGAVMKGISYNILQNRQDAEECVNDSCLGMWNAIPPTHPNPLYAFVCRVTRNTALVRYRYNKAAKRNGHYNVNLEEISNCLFWEPQSMRK